MNPVHLWVSWMASQLHQAAAHETSKYGDVSFPKYGALSQDSQRLSTGRCSVSPWKGVSPKGCSR